MSNIEIEYSLEESKKFLLEVWQMKDDENPDFLENQELLGTVDLSLHQVVGGSGQTVTLPIKGRTKVQGMGLITITAEEKHPSKGETAYVQFKGEVNDPNYLFFIIWKEIDGGRGQVKPVYKSEVK